MRVLNLLEDKSSSTQREISESMDVSLGKINFLLSSLIKAGHIKVQRFKNSRNKRAYFYILTPRGIRQKAVLTRHFFERKTLEYKRLKKEIEELKKSIKD